MRGRLDDSIEMTECHLEYDQIFLVCGFHNKGWCPTNLFLPHEYMGEGLIPGIHNYIVENSVLKKFGHSPNGNLVILILSCDPTSFVYCAHVGGQILLLGQLTSPKFILKLV